MGPGREDGDVAVREALAWIAAGCFFVAWVANEYLLTATKRQAALAYTQGVVKGAAEQAAKPCTWQQLFRQESGK
jgi:hypothetical protein